MEIISEVIIIVTERAYGKEGMVEGGRVTGILRMDGNSSISRESFERGVSYGELLAREILGCHKEASRLVMLQTGIEWEFLKDSKISVLHKWKEHLCRKPYKEFLEEMQGMVQGVGKSYQTVR